MGTITKRKWKNPQGKHFVRYQAEVRMKGQRIAKTFKTRNECRSFISEQENLIHRGYSTTIGKKIKVREAIKKYLKEVSILKGSHHNEKGIWDRLIKNNRRFTELKLADITPTHILELRNRSKLRGKTVANYELKLLSHLFNTAIKVWRYVETNPVSPIEKFKTSRGRYAPLYFEEYRKILEYAKTDWVLYLHILILRNGGFRPKEVHSLTHNDLDLIKNLIVVRKQKAQNTYRLVPLKPYIIKLIVESKAWHGTNYIIPQNKNTLNTRWQKLKKNLGLIDRQLYDFRRTFAHNFIDYKKGDIPEMCRIGGWSDWEMAHRYYGKDSVRY